MESNMRTGQIELLFMLGRWDEALAVTADEQPLAQSMAARSSLASAALVHSERGDPTAARAILAANDAVLDSDQPRSPPAMTLSKRASCAPRDRRSMRWPRPSACSTRTELAVDDLSFKRAWVEGVEAALELSDAEKAEELLSIAESLDPGELTPFLQASALRLRARLEVAHGGVEGIDERLVSAAALFREFGMVFHLAVTELEHGEWLVGQGRRDEAEPLLVEAREIFERLEAKPWLQRLAAAAATQAVSA